MVTRSQVIELWQTCFHDDEAFVHLYFSRVYNPRYLHVCEQEGVPAAMLQALPYTLMAWDTTMACAYVAGVATHPQYRGRGLMHSLIADTLGQLHDEQVPVSLLIPATPSLYGFYASSGYATVCYTCPGVLAPPPAMPQGYGECSPGADACYDLYDALSRKRKAAVLHTRDDFEVILADLQLSGGRVHCVADDGGTPQAVALVVAGERQVAVKDYVAVHNTARNALLYCLQQHYGSRTLVCDYPATGGMPRAMLRVVNADALLRLWAAAHREVDVVLAVTDALIPGNNICRHVSHGTVSVGAATSAPVVKLSVDSLAAFLFGQLRVGNCPVNPVVPYVTLMLD